MPYETIIIDDSHHVEIVPIQDAGEMLNFYSAEVLLFTAYNDFGKDIDLVKCSRYLRVYQAGIVTGMNKGKRKLQYQIKNLLDID